MMETKFPIFAVIAGVGVITLTALFGWLDRKKLPAKASIRRGTGSALFGLQQFIEPSVEHIVQAQNVEQKEEEDDQGLGDGDEQAVRSGLAEALRGTPVDPEEVRRHLSGAKRLDLDWRAIFEQAVADELRERPFRAPSMPPAKRVAPRE
jgi:predicted transcriptional regulator